MPVCQGAYHFLPDTHHVSLLSLALFDAGAKNREQIYSAFENIYPVTLKFRKAAEPVEGGTAN